MQIKQVSVTGDSLWLLELDWSCIGLWGVRVRSILCSLMSHCQTEQQSGLQHAMQRGHPCHVVPLQTVSLCPPGKGTLQECVIIKWTWKERLYGAAR